MRRKCIFPEWMTSWAKMVGTIPFLGFHLTKILRAGYSALIHIDALHTIEILQSVQFNRWNLLTNSVYDINQWSNSYDRKIKRS